jgi:hypothetical protein
MKTRLLETKFETARITQRKFMNRLIHVISRKISSARGQIRCPPLSGIFLLVPLLVACFVLSQTARAINPAPGTLTTSGSSGTSDGVLNFGNLPLAGHSPTYTSFDAPGAGTGPFQGTAGYAINPAGEIAGQYIDPSRVYHGLSVVPTALSPRPMARGRHRPRQGTRRLSAASTRRQWQGFRP